MEVENENKCLESVNDLTVENSSGKTNPGFVESDDDDVKTVSIEVPTIPVRTRPKCLNDLLDNDKGTDPAKIIEAVEPENLIVDLDPAQFLLEMFDDTPDPISFEHINEAVFAKHSVDVNNDGSKRFKGSDTVSKDDFVLMIKEYPCLYDTHFLGKTDPQTKRLKKHAWQEIAKITDRTVESVRDRWSQFNKKAEAGNVVYVRLMSMLDDNISRPYNQSPSKRRRDSTLDDALLKENNSRQAPANVPFDDKENVDPKVNYLEEHGSFFSDINKQLERLAPSKQKELKSLAMVEIQRIASTLCK